MNNVRCWDGVAGTTVKLEATAQAQHLPAGVLNDAVTGRPAIGVFISCETAPVRLCWGDDVADDFGHLLKDGEKYGANNPATIRNLQFIESETPGGVLFVTPEY